MYTYRITTQTEPELNTPILCLVAFLHEHLEAARTEPRGRGAPPPAKPTVRPHTTTHLKSSNNTTNIMQ